MIEEEKYCVEFCSLKQEEIKKIKRKVKKMENMERNIAKIFLFSVFAIIAGLGIGIVFAPTFENHQYATSATVNSYVDTSTNASTIPFGAVDANSQNNPATTTPINLTNTANSNTAIDVYMNATNLTSGGNKIPYFNLTVRTSDVAVGSTALNESQYINGTSANQGFIENIGVSSSTNLFYWLDVPTAQASGLYEGILVVHSVADGTAP